MSTAFGFHTTGDEIVKLLGNRVKDRTFLVTGPSPGGIGAETAKCIAKACPKLLILAGRSKEKTEPVLDDLRHKAADTDFIFVNLDLSSQLSVKDAVEKIIKLKVKIDVLINNAAIMACPFSKTIDGIETQFGTNHIGPFLFTNLLLKAGVISNGGTIVNVSSSAAVRQATSVVPHFDDLNYDEGKTYDPIVAYSVSKSAICLYTRTLAQKLKSRNITVFSLNPGSIASPLQRYLTEEMRQHAFNRAMQDNPD